MATTTKSANGQSEAKQRPVFAKTFFPVKVAVFQHTHDGRQNYSAKVTKSFRRDEQSAWETTEYLSLSDLLPAARLLAEAYDAIQSRLDEAYCERNDGKGRSQERC